MFGATLKLKGGLLGKILLSTLARVTAEIENSCLRSWLMCSQREPKD